MDNLLVVISGPSGGGKGTVINRILSRDNPEYIRVSTYTTRPKRADESLYRSISFYYTRAISKIRFSRVTYGKKYS